jgi:hypothetical protein
MLYKHGADFIGLQPPMWYALGVADAVYAAHGQQMVLSVGTNGIHSVPDSLHAKGFAVDIRTRNVPQSTMDIIYAEMKKRLYNLGYDVIDERGTVSNGVPQPHVHIEYDPKPGRDSYVKEFVEV